MFLLQKILMLYNQVETRLGSQIWVQFFCVRFPSPFYKSKIILSSGVKNGGKYMYSWRTVVNRFLYRFLLWRREKKNQVKCTEYLYLYIFINTKKYMCI